MRTPSFILAAAFLLLSSVAHAGPADDLKKIPGGTFQLDPRHASVTFKITHLGFSRYTGRFNKMEATLKYDNITPAKSTLEATVYPGSVDTNDKQLEDELRDPKWFNAEKYPAAVFKSTKIEITSPTTAKITGDLTMMGITHPILLDATLLGAGEHPMSKKSVLGFSATGVLTRSVFGFTNGLPFVGDDVALQIEAEFNKVD